MTGILCVMAGGGKTVGNPAFLSGTYQAWNSAHIPIPAPGPATAFFKLDIDSILSHSDVTDIDGDPHTENYCSPAGETANFEVRIDQTSNVGTYDLTGDALSTWLRLDVARQWDMVNSAGPGDATCSANVQIRNRYSLAVLATCTVLYTAKTT